MISGGNRHIAVVVGILLVSALILVRLFSLQVLRADQYKAEAEFQQNVSLISLPHRGDIFLKDHSGRLFPAATTRKAYALSGNPQRIDDSTIKASYDSFSHSIDLDWEDFSSRAKDNKTYVVFKKNIDRDTALKLADLEVSGFWLEEEMIRLYPENNQGSHILGFVGFSHNEHVGQYGIEKQYEDVLRGVSGSISGSRSAGGTFLSLGRNILGKRQDGYDVVLTIDSNIQSMATQITADMKEEWNASSAGMLVMNPRTGAILAMHAEPSFNPNTYSEVKNYELFLNPFVHNVMEMGSIVKPLTMAAGLDARAITENTVYYDAGKIAIRDAIISNYDGKSRGRQTMYDILDQSLNTGSVFIMQQLGSRSFRDYFERYGLGDKTGIDLPNEAGNNIRNLEVGGPVEYATASFGQGIAVTPMALASALSALANGGNLMKPYIVDKIISEGKILEETKPTIRRRVIKEETSEAVSRMLTKVVDNTLAGGLVHMDGYSIAAKTGTAQIPNPDGSGYLESYLHTFFGYAPAYNPEFLVFLFLDRPQEVRYASQTLSEPFHEITEFMIDYLQIPPDRNHVSE